MASPTKLQTGFQSLTKDFLRFWMVDIHWEGQIQKSAPQKRHKVHLTSVARNWGWDHGGNKVHCTWGECVPEAPGSLSCLDGEGTKRRPRRVWAFVKYPRTWTWIAYACKVHATQGPLLVEQIGAWEVYMGKAHTPWEEGKPSVARTLISPHMPVTFLCSAPPSPQHEWTSYTKQETTCANLCQGRN